MNNFSLQPSAFSLSDKAILITGASSGFGAAAARAFGAQRCKLLLGARRLDRLETVAAEARQAGAVEAHVHPLDVTQTASVGEFARWARAKTNSVDVLINNAGGAHGLDRWPRGGMKIGKPCCKPTCSACCAWLGPCCH